MTRDPKTLCRGALLALLGLIGMVVTQVPAGADDTVTYSATITVPAPPASNFSGASGGGDGWAVGLTSTQLFNVFHHSSSLTVNCHNQSDASNCWSGPQTVTDGTGGHYSTSIAPGLYVDQATGRMYVPATRNADSVGGVACIDTTKPADATGPDLFCGFTALTPADDAMSGGSGLAAPIQIGSKWYVFNEYSGSSTGARNTLLCFDLDTLAACAGQPFAVDKGASELSSFTYAYPPGVVGTRVVMQAPGTSSLACFDAATSTECAGSWPAPISGLGGAPFPVLDANGVPTGVCVPTSGLPCVDLQGASMATPANLDAAITPTYEYGGPSLTLGARVYAADPAGNQVDCFDFNLGTGCANFPKSFNNLGLLYTVNVDPQRPTCIWVNADNGSAQIQNFDAFSGGGCGAGAIRVLSSSIVVPSSACIPASYESLRIVAPDRSTYTSGSIDFQDGSGNAIPGFATHALDGTGTANLTDLALSTTSALPQFLITLDGFQGTLGSVSVELVWKGTYAESCQKPGTTVTGLPVPEVPNVPNVPAAPKAQGYRIAAVDGGVFSFGASPFAGSLGGAPINGRIVGIAETPSGAGYWLVGADGGVFTFGDAAFLGSVPGLGIRVGNIVGIAPTPSGNGYWMVGADGGVFSFGDAAYRGSAVDDGIVTTGVRGIAATPSGNGYWLVKTDGGVLSYGNAVFHGSLPERAVVVNDVVGIAATDTGNGYWLVERNGGVHAFGSAPFAGAPGDLGITPKPIVGLLGTPSSGGYWLVESNGGVLSFGDATFQGSLALSSRNAPPGGVAG
jgi:hypothetical protein